MDQKASANRKLTIAKMRGTPLDRTSFEYLIGEKYGGIGPIVFPERANILNAPTDRLSTGIEGLDKILHGGVFRGSITLIQGASGVGKTIACLQFSIANALKGEKALFVSLEEPTGQIMKTITNMGYKLKTLNDKIVIDSYVPEALTPLQYYKLVKDMMDEHSPTVLVFDPISTMQYFETEKEFINFGRYLQLLAKQKEITLFLTSAVSSFKNSQSITLSLLTDNIIHMRYSEMQEKMRRQFIIVKTRGSGHDNKIVDFEIIPGKGIEIKTDMALAKECLT
jgi:circadian clock protein KaiC